MKGLIDGSGKWGWFLYKVGGVDLNGKARRKYFILILSLLSLSFESVPESDKKQSKNNRDQEKSVDHQNCNL